MELRATQAYTYPLTPKRKQKGNDCQEWQSLVLYQMIILICIILFVLLANLYLYHHFPKPKHPLQDISYDVAIVLGYPCNADGSLSTVQKKLWRLL